MLSTTKCFWNGSKQTFSRPANSRSCTRNELDTNYISHDSWMSWKCVHGYILENIVRTQIKQYTGSCGARKAVVWLCPIWSLQPENSDYSCFCSTWCLAPPLSYGSVEELKVPTVFLRHPEATYRQDHKSPTGKSKRFIMNDKTVLS